FGGRVGGGCCAHAAAGVADGAAVDLVGGGDPVAVVRAGSETGVGVGRAVGVRSSHCAPCSPGGGVAAGLALDAVTGDGGAAVLRGGRPRDSEAAVTGVRDAGGSGDAGRADDGDFVAVGGVRRRDASGVGGPHDVLVGVAGQDALVDVR